MQRHPVTAFRLNARMKNDIGLRVREEREKKEISRAVLAKAAGISLTALSDLELGRTRSTPALHRIAEKRGVQVKWLETGTVSRSSLANMASSSTSSGGSAASRGIVR